MLEGVREGRQWDCRCTVQLTGISLSNRKTMSAQRAERQCRQGRAVQLIMPPMSGTDFNDVAAMADYTDFTTDPSKGNGFAGGDWGDPDMGIL